MVEELFVKFPERKESWPKQNMLGVLSKPEDYRGIAVFLLSDASRFMTGSDVRIGKLGVDLLRQKLIPRRRWTFGVVVARSRR